MTEAGFPAHDLPSREPEPRAGPDATTTPLHHDVSGDIDSAAASAVIATAGVASTSEIEPGPGPSSMRNSSNTESVTAAKPGLSLSPPGVGEESKESFLNMARTPDPDAEGEARVRSWENRELEEEEEEDVRREKRNDVGEDTEMNASAGSRFGALGEPSRRDPHLGDSTSPALQGTASTDDSGYEGQTELRGEMTMVEDENDIANGRSWHPLSPGAPPSPHGRAEGVEEGEEKNNGGQDVTIVVEEGDVVDSHGRVLFHEDDLDEKPSAVNSPRTTSHLRLDLKPPSPQPWDLVDPPESNGHRPKPDIYPPNESRFHTLQSRNRSLIPKSSYYFGPPPPDSAYGTPPIGQIGVHHPREVLRIERDYTGGELCQFAPIYPLELEGRITPTHFLESINAINELLISAHSLRHSFFDNMLAVLTLQISRIVLTSHYEKEMERLRQLFDELNSSLFNPVGLNLLWPRKVAFLYLEIEYY